MRNQRGPTVCDGLVLFPWPSIPLSGYVPNRVRIYPSSQNSLESWSTYSYVLYLMHALAFPRLRENCGRAAAPLKAIYQLANADRVELLMKSTLRLLIKRTRRPSFLCLSSIMIIVRMDTGKISLLQIVCLQACKYPHVSCR